MIQTYKVIVSAVILNQDKQVLLGKRSMDEDVFPGLWGIPGGKIEVEQSTENAIEETLIREAMEEMGITIKPIGYIESECVVKGGQAKLYIVFTAEHVDGQPQALEDTDEVKWWSFEELSPEMLTPKTYENIRLALDRS